MTKSEIVKAIEKQSKADAKNAREVKNRQTAEIIINGQPILFGVRVMDPDSEKVLDEILAQYDGNDDNHVNFCVDVLPRSLQISIAVQYEKLKMYGVVSSCIPYMGGAIITLSDTAKTYKERKRDAIQKEYEEKEKREKLETDFLKIQGMSADQLRGIYLEAIVANQKLQETIDLQMSQLQTLKDIFASGEDGVAVQKEIMQMLIVKESDKHPVRKYLADKGGDLGIEAIKAVAPMIWSVIKEWLTTEGIIIP